MILISLHLMACYLPYFVVVIVTMVTGKTSTTLMLVWYITSGVNLSELSVYILLEKQRT